MDDREAVAAIVAGDQAGLADIYDRYAASLYGYCRNMLHEPADAADAVQDTFVIAAARLNGLRDSHKLRPWLYAVARNECLRKLRSRETPSEIAETEDVTAAEVGESAQRAELRELVRAAISGLNPPDREVIELNLRHDLDGADLATVLGVSRSHAHAMASRARGQLERSLGVLLVARTGRRACPALDLMLTDWDGRLTILLRKRVSRHIDQCEECGERKRSALRPAMLFGLPALPLLPPRLRDRVLHLCADETPAGVETKRSIVKQAGSFGPNGFPRPARDRRHGMGDPAAAMVAAVSVAVAAAVIIAMIVLRGSAPLHTLDAKAGTGAAGAAVNSSTEVPPNSSLLSPTVTRPGSRSAAVRPPVASPAFPFSTGAPGASGASGAPTPSRSHRPRPSKSPKPSKSPSQSPSPSPSPTTTSPSPSPSTTPPVTHSPSPPPTTQPPPTTPPPGTA
ncbi:MAG: sigma-70 family RNA polymerase sigma factor [Streptosporangiaceae bacterium]|nr:sigma-70 family RNA polymerase sigma factor [Streptosporangiaceae bacterium]